MGKLFTTDQNQDIILAAVNSLASIDFKDKWDFEKAVIRRSLTIQSLMREDGSVMRVMDSIRLYAHVDDVRYEESSKRYVLTFTVPGEDAEPEQIRTPRMDTPAGKLIEDIVKISAGKNVIIYKNNEPAPENAKGRVPSSGYRVCPWIDIVS